MAWKPGPLPPDTWFWGGVVPKGEKSGFYFADFCDDHVKTCPGGDIIKAADVEWYDNDIRLPPGLGPFWEFRSNARIDKPTERK